MLASLQVQKSREVATLRGQLNALTKVEVRKYSDHQTSIDFLPLVFFNTSIVLLNSNLN